MEIKKICRELYLGLDLSNQRFNPSCEPAAFNLHVVMVQNAKLWHKRFFLFFLGLKGRIRVGIELIGWIRIRITLQITSKTIWNMSLFELFFKVLSLYLEARVRIRIGIKGSSRIRIRTTKMRICNTALRCMCLVTVSQLCWFLKAVKYLLSDWQALC
jgi:hypothetical protein